MALAMNVNWTRCVAAAAAAAEGHQHKSVCSSWRFVTK